MFGSICPCGIEGFAWLDKWEIFVLSDSACIYECAGQRHWKKHAYSFTLMFESAVKVH